MTNPFEYPNGTYLAFMPARSAIEISGVFMHAGERRAFLWLQNNIWRRVARIITADFTAKR